MSKLQIRNHPLRKMNPHLHNIHRLKLSLNNSQKMPPSLSSSKKAKPAQHTRPKTIPLLHSRHTRTPLLHCNHKTNPFLNNENNMLWIHLHLYPAKTVIVHFQITGHNSNCSLPKIPVPYQRNQDTVYIQNLIKFNQLCLFFSFQITTKVHEPHSMQFFQDFSFLVIYSLKCLFAFSFQYQSDAFIIFFLFQLAFFFILILTLFMFRFLFPVLVPVQ